MFGIGLNWDAENWVRELGCSKLMQPLQPRIFATQFKPRCLESGELHITKKIMQSANPSEAYFTCGIPAFYHLIIGGHRSLWKRKHVVLFIKIQDPDARFSVRIEFPRNLEILVSTNSFGSAE
ncbi:hypothetical protein Dsin_016412 [Dipteronia sinensis]|uniref:Uncharacterized protein n=1 Tax=Dipteronia sinensis TaxID=43782 RepID=A0AAE0AD20_9ROSI|nr:hypothetical protein Dsin_016412 [Dipteronia sinensis]